MVTAILSESLPQNQVRCHLCPRFCRLKEGQRGYCLARQNKGGKLYSLTYGQVASLSVNPIEKKPVFHFYPGSDWLSLGSLGCNFRCPGCQNWEIAHATLEQRETFYLSPQDSIKLTLKYHCRGICWTFNEPTIWLEYTLEGAKLAKQEGLFTSYVTNGYITAEALDVIGPYLDVFRVDIKGFSRQSYGRIGHIADFRPVLEATRRAKEKWQMHVEVVTNVIPEYNDSGEELQEIALWIQRYLGPLTPWHLTRFFPHLELSHLEPTPIVTLEKAREKALELGLRYVYLGNVLGHPGENTRCHDCGELLIRRKVFNILECKIEQGKCPRCLTEIPGRFD